MPNAKTQKAFGCLHAVLMSDMHELEVHRQIECIELKRSKELRFLLNHTPSRGITVGYEQPGQSSLTCSIAEKGFGTGRVHPTLKDL